MHLLHQNVRNGWMNSYWKFKHPWVIAKKRHGKGGGCYPHNTSTDWWFQCSRTHLGGPPKSRYTTIWGVTRVESSKPLTTSFYAGFPTNALHCLCTYLYEKRTKDFRPMFPSVTSLHIPVGSATFAHSWVCKEVLVRGWDGQLQPSVKSKVLLLLQQSGQLYMWLRWPVRWLDKGNGFIIGLFWPLCCWVTDGSTGRWLKGWMEMKGRTNRWKNDEWRWKKRTGEMVDRLSGWLMAE